MKLRGLYAITDERLTPWETMLYQVEQALDGGASLVQLRDKSRSNEELLGRAKQLTLLCERYGALFVINDRVELALQCGAHALHIGEEDGEVAAVRERAKDLLLGVSCYGDLERAVCMQRLGADYVAFGAVFASSTKSQASVIGTQIFGEAKKALHIPVCAIGGITAQNAASCMEAGADMVAVISSIWNYDDIVLCTRNFLKPNKG